MFNPLSRPNGNKLAAVYVIQLTCYPSLVKLTFKDVPTSRKVLASLKLDHLLVL